MRVASHALNDIDVQRAAQAGVDVLAHTPTERLSDKTIAAWSGRAVISTLAAFSALAEPAENVRRLRASGVTVLYGTDMGYTKIPGINPQELELLAKAGLDNQAIVAAGTTVPARYWGFLDGIGTLAVGHTASFLVLDANPEIDPQTLSRPLAVYLDGRLIGQ
jgi:imidazolonepropionase-like amidohydrolase